MIVRGKYVIGRPDQKENGGVIIDGAVHVADGKIHEIGNFDSIRRRYPEEQVLGSTNHIVSPGFVNAHQHGRGITTIEMGIPDDSLELLMFSLIGEPYTDPRLSARLAAMRLIETGVTTIVHSHRHYGSPGEKMTLYRAVLDETIDGFMHCGTRVAFALDAKNRQGLVYGDHVPFLALLPDDLKRRLEPLSKAYENFDPKLWFSIFDSACSRCNHTRIQMLFGPFTAHSCTEDFLLELMEAGRKRDVMFHMHALETPYNVGYADRYLGKRQLEYFKEIGFLGPDVTLVHCVWASDDDISIVAESGASVVTCPSSNLRLRSGIAPVTPLFRAGVNIGLGMDGITINDEEDMFQEMRLIRNLHGIPGHQQPCLETRDVFRMATEGGARAAGMWDTTGSIAVGKSADLILVRMDEIVTPFMDLPDQLIDALVLRGRPRYVDTVMVEGEILYQDGSHVSGNPKEIKKQLIDSAFERLEASPKTGESLLTRIRPFVVEYYKGWNPPSPEPHYCYNGRTWKGD